MADEGAQGGQEVALCVPVYVRVPNANCNPAPLRANVDLPIGSDAGAVAAAVDELRQWQEVRDRRGFDPDVLEIEVLGPHAEEFVPLGPADAVAAGTRAICIVAHPNQVAPQAPPPAPAPQVLFTQRDTGVFVLNTFRRFALPPAPRSAEVMWGACRRGWAGDILLGAGTRESTLYGPVQSIVQTVMRSVVFRVAKGDDAVKPSSRSKSVTGSQKVPDLVVHHVDHPIVNPATNERDYASFYAILEVRPSLTPAVACDALGQVFRCGCLVAHAGRTGTLATAITDLKTIQFMSMRLQNGNFSSGTLSERVPLLAAKSPVERNTVVFPDGEATPGFNALCALFSQQAIAANWQ